MSYYVGAEGGINIMKLIIARELLGILLVYEILSLLGVTYFWTNSFAFKN